MVQGFERRDVIEDANSKSRAMDAQSVPVSGPTSPRGADFSRVGQAEREIADILGQVDVGIQRYVEKKSKQWGLEGQMMRAEGKTLEEARAAGNTYTERGWRTLDTKIASDQLVAEESAYISQTGKMVSPAEYQKTLSERYKERAAALGNDPDAREMLDAYAADMYPKLAAEQTRQHLEYNRGQMKDRGRKGIVSTAHTDDPEMLKEYIGTLKETMAPEDFNEITAGALSDDYAMGSDRVERAIREANPAPTKRTTLAPANVTNILNLVGQAESKNSYTAVYGGDNPRLTTMTLDDVLALPARPTGKDGVNSSAVGKYQIIRDTLKGLKADLGLRGDEMFDEDLQDRLGTHLLQRDAKVDDFLAGKITPEQFQFNLSKVWAGIPKDKSGASYYGNDGVNKATVEPGMVLQALGGDQSGNSLYDSLSALGVRNEDITKTMKAREAFERENAAKFDASRLLTERDIENAAIDLSDDDLLKQIGDAKDANGYSDAWANQLWNSALSKRKSDMVERKKEIKVGTLIATNSVSQGSKEEREKAIDIVTQQALAANPDAIEPQSPNNTNARRAAQSQVYQFMYNNQITDDRLKSSWEVATVGDIVDSKGRAKPAAVDAYSSYLQASNSTNDPLWAQTLLSDKTKDLFLMADSYRSGEDQVDAEQALVAASAFIQKQNSLKGVNNLPWWKDTMRTNAVTEKLVNNTLPGILSGFGIGRTQAQMRWQINGDGVEKAAKSRDVTDRIKQQAAKMWNSYKHWDDQNAAQELTIAKATNEVMQKSEYVAGTFVYTGDQPSISQRIGMGGIKNAANMVTSRIMSELGPTIWKDYNETDYFTHSQTWYAREPGVGKVWEATKTIVGDTFGAPLQTLDHVQQKIGEKRLGIPDFSVIMNPSGNALVLAPYTNYDRTQQGAPFILSVEKMREAASYLNKGDEEGFKKWAEAQKASLPKY